MAQVGGFAEDICRSRRLRWVILIYDSIERGETTITERLFNVRRLRFLIKKKGHKNYKFCVSKFWNSWHFAFGCLAGLLVAVSMLGGNSQLELSLVLSELEQSHQDSNPHSSNTVYKEQYRSTPYRRVHSGHHSFGRPYEWATNKTTIVALLKLLPPNKT